MALSFESSDTHIILVQDRASQTFEHSVQSGPPGLSAYQISLNNGFVGTQQEWIDSLKGSTAYEIALNNGFVGTEEEWLTSLKVGIGVELSDKGKLLTNDGYQEYWVDLEHKLNSDSIQWDLGEFS